MGVYAECLTRFKTFRDLTAERKRMLARISELRGGRDILVFAADLSAPPATPIAIDYTDILAVQDQLENMSGDGIDIVLETPGGLGEVVEDIVKLIHAKYQSVGMIVPGYAKSAGTIFAMAGDEILMGRSSSLGPIDGQLQLASGKGSSADAFLEGFAKIKEEAENRKHLTPAYIPILQNISPGEIQKCENVRAFSRHLVTGWLADYKFKFWDRHSDGRPVTCEDRRNRAAEVAASLCSQSKWLTHDRSIKIDDLEKLRVKITNYDRDAELCDAITRYHALLRMSFEVSAAYKLFETPESQICRFSSQEGTLQARSIPTASRSRVKVACPECQASYVVQVNWEEHVPVDHDAVPYSDVVRCPACEAQSPLERMLLRLEATAGKRAVV